MVDITLPMLKVFQEHSAALALVTVHQERTGSPTDDRQQDVDTQRIRDLLELHQNVKLRYQQTPDAGLQQARNGVEQILRRLNQAQG